MHANSTANAQRFSSIEALETRIAPAVIFGVDGNQNLISFNSDAPETIVTKAITGLGVNERIEGLDFRPATGQLYALGITDTAGDDEGRLYVVNPRTGAATLVGSGPFSTTLADSADYGFDFNPQVDRIRIVNDADQNLRVNPNNGALVANDAPLNDAMGAETIAGSAYDRNFDGTASTTLFGIDFTNSTLVLQGSPSGTPNSPNGGSITTVGELGVTLDSRRVGFDIASSQNTATAYASLRVGTSTGLYTIDLQTGAATLVGPIGDGSLVLRGLSVSLPSVTMVDDRTATYIDENGDKVKITVSKGRLSADDFQFSTRENGSQLRSINLSDDGDEFSGANITITARPTSAGGDGFANIGFLNAAGVDLGKVRITGDLGRIVAGDSTTATTGLALLKVSSMGLLGETTQLPNSGSLQSTITGPLGKLVVRGDLSGAGIAVTGDLEPDNGRIGIVRVAGSLIGTGVDASGAITATGDIVSVFVGGSLRGSTGDLSGTILSGGRLSFVTIIGSTIGGDGERSGFIQGNDSIGSVFIGSDLRGGEAENSGTIRSTGKIKSVFVGGSVEGSTGASSGSIIAGKNIGSVNISESLRGGSGIRSGSIATTDGGDIRLVKIGGSLEGGTNDLTGIFSTRNIGTVKIADEIRGNGTTPVNILALGVSDPPSVADLPSIGNVQVGGSVQRAEILAGYTLAREASNPDAVIQRVFVGGNWIASSIAAGVDPVDGQFGNDDDVKILEITDPAGVHSSIAKIVIRGQALGTPTVSGSPSASDHYGFVAEQIVRLRVGSVAYQLNPGPNNDLSGIAIGSTGDLRAREVTQTGGQI
jgi:hypothetical protein